MRWKEEPFVVVQQSIVRKGLETLCSLLNELISELFFSLLGGKKINSRDSYRKDKERERRQRKREEIEIEREGDRGREIER